MTVRLSPALLLICACGDATPAEEVDAGPDAFADPCPTARFKTVTPHPDNAAFPDPVLDVRCSDSELLVDSNGIPSHAFVPVSPIMLEEQPYAWHVPLAPAAGAAPVDLPALGAVGFAIDGLPFYGPIEGMQPHPWGDAMLNGVLDACLGHVGLVGEYHFHNLAEACLDAPSPVLGYALDGFPVYGPTGCTDAACDEVIELRSAWVQRMDASIYAWDAYEYAPTGAAGELDRCNGRVQPDGSYGYHLTATWPYTIGCFTGTPTPDDVGAIGPNQSTRTIADAQRAACTTTADCAGACSAGSRCECVDLPPLGLRCAMTCDDDDDCPFDPQGSGLLLRCDEPTGLCTAG